MLHIEAKVMLRKSKTLRNLKTNTSPTRLAVIVSLSMCTLFAISVIITSVQHAIEHRCVDSAAYRKIYNRLIRTYRIFVCDKPDASDPSSLQEKCIEENVVAKLADALGATKFNWRIYYERMERKCEMLRHLCDDDSRRSHGVRTTFDITDTNNLEPCVANVVNTMTAAFASWTLSSEVCLQITDQLEYIESHAKRFDELDKIVEKATLCFSN